MYVCICKGVTDSQIRRAVCEQGVDSLRALRRELGACNQCGKCALQARELIRDYQAELRIVDTALLNAA